MKNTGIHYFALILVSSFIFSGTSGARTFSPYEDTVITNEINRFSDLKNGTLEALAVNYLANLNIIGGRPDGTFDGQATVNRAEAAKFLLLSAGKNIKTNFNNNQFPDVKRDEWYAPFVLTAAELNIINGYPNGTFAPAQPVNQAEFLSMFTRIFNLGHNNTKVWYDGYYHSTGLYDLFPQGPSHKPNQNLSRTQVAIALYQFLTYDQTAGSDGSDSSNDDTYDDDHNYDDDHDSDDDTAQDSSTHQLVATRNTTIENTKIVKSSQKNIKALSVNIAAQDKTVTIEGVTMRRVGNGHWSDFSHAWLENNLKPITRKTSIRNEFFTLNLDEPMVIKAGESKSLVLKVDLSGRAENNSSSRFVIYNPAWIRSDNKPVGLFPMRGFDIQVFDE